MGGLSLPHLIKLFNKYNYALTKKLSTAVNLTKPLQRMGDSRAVLPVIEDDERLAGLLRRQRNSGAGRRRRGRGLRCCGKDGRGAKSEKNEKPGVE